MSFGDEVPCNNVDNSRTVLIACSDSFKTCEEEDGDDIDNISQSET